MQKADTLEGSISEVFLYITFLKISVKILTKCFAENAIWFSDQFFRVLFLSFLDRIFKNTKTLFYKKNNNKAPVIGRSKIKICARNVQQQTNFSNMLNKWHCQVFNKRTCLTKCCWFVRLILLFTSRHTYDLAAAFSYQFKIFRRKQFCQKLWPSSLPMSTCFNNILPFLWI